MLKREEKEKVFGGGKKGFLDFRGTWKNAGLE